ncbi:MAG: hypothetical protein ACRC57_14395 [Sarcina sp.]
MKNKLNEFYKVSKILENHNIIPLLFGSLGLQQLIEENLNPYDIDILIPSSFIENNWNLLESYMLELGYKLYDLHEHKFNNGSYYIAFASIEDLKPFANINLCDIKTIKNEKASYKLLSLNQYLAVYKKSSIDSYRCSKNNNKDLYKIDLIQKYLNKNKL